MFSPGKHTESATLVGYLEAQLTAVRASAYGLTDAQARETPCRSALSSGGLVKHVTWVMQQRLATVRTPLDQAGFGVYMGSFALTDGETLDGVIGQFDAVAAEYLANAGAAEPGAGMTAPPAPWDGVDTPTESVQRFELVHHIEEFARHAGHADVVREQLDGAASGPLLMALQGHAGNAFVQPWTPAG